MANTIQKNTILDGPRHAIVQAWFASDGTTGDLSDEVVVDLSALSVPQDKTSISSLVVEHISASATGCSAELSFDRTTNQGIYEIPTDSTETVDFKAGGGSGILDNGSGGTGDILINTTGFSGSGDDIFLKIKVRKKFTV